MSDINDALAHEIIRSAHEVKPASRGAFHTASHPLNMRSFPAVTMPSPAALLALVAAGFRADVARLAALFAPRPVTSQACCPAVS